MNAWTWLEAGFWMGLGMGGFIALPQILAWGPNPRWWARERKEKDHD